MSVELVRTSVFNVRLLRERGTNDVYVGRRGHNEDGFWGNPIRLGGSVRGVTLRDYSRYLRTRWTLGEVFRRRALTELAGKRLLCFCLQSDWSTNHPGGLLCHAQILATFIDLERGLECSATKQIEEWLAGSN